MERRLIERRGAEEPGDTMDHRHPTLPGLATAARPGAPHVLCVLTLRTEQMKVGAPCLAGFARHGSLRTMGTMGSSASGHSQVSQLQRDLGHPMFFAF